MATARHLFTVEHVFEIPKHGIVLVPGIQPIEDELFRIGDPVRLKRPDGTTLQACITGLELLDPNPRRDVTILLTLSKSDVPIGTEVWSL